MKKYEKILNDFYDYCRNTDYKDRIKFRNENDFRLSEGLIYKENHHIIPKSLGGDDSHDNLIYLLPEEHLFVHKLRWKVYKNNNDMLAVRFMINGYNNNKFKKNNCLHITRKIRNSYVFLKQNSYLVRLNGGWQTEDGRKRISESRKGKMPVIDSNTREMIGSVSVNHKNVKDGTWIHHTSGMMSVIDKNGINIRISNVDYNKEEHIPLNSVKGEKNPRYYDISNDEIIKLYHYHIERIGFIISYNLLSKLLIIDGKKILPEIRNGGFRFTNGSSELTINARDKYEEEYIDLSVKGIKKNIKEKYLDNKTPREIIKEYVNELNNKKEKRSDVSI